MTSSGIPVSDDVLATYADMKTKHTMKAIFLGVSGDESKIELIETWTKNDMGADEIDNLRKLAEKLKGREDGCYIIYDFHFVSKKTNNENEKLLFVSWVPDTLKIKRKMLYGSSKESTKQKFEGIQGIIHAVDDDDLTCDAFTQAVDK